jgi:hypothetical protein
VSGEDRALERVADLLAGWLPDDQREEARHELEELAREDDGVALLRELVEIHRAGEASVLYEHVHPLHLLDHLERPASQPAHREAWIREHLAGCAACRDDIETLRAVGDAEAGAAEAAGRRRPSLLAGVAAAAAVVGAFAGIGLWEWWNAPAPDPAVRPVTEITVGSGHVFRGGAAGPARDAEVLEVPRPPEDGDLVVLRLDTGLSREALRGGTDIFVVEVRSGEESWTLRRRPEDFGPYGHLSLMLPGRIVAGAEPVQVRVRRDAGETVFSRSLRFTEESTGSE